MKKKNKKNKKQCIKKKKGGISTSFPRWKTYPSFSWP